jgi:hypothetical protein
MRVTGTLLLAAVVAASAVVGFGATATAAPRPHDAPARAAGGGAAGRDFTGDHRPDIIARSASSGGLYLYRHSGSLNGTGTYAAARLLDSGWGSMRWIGAADLSGDGLADVVSIDGAGVMRVAVNVGGTRLAPNRIINYGWDITELVMVTDYDGDGYDDLMASTATDSSTFSFYRNNGGITPTTTFASPQVAFTGFSPFAAAVGDFTRDGVPDMLWTTGSWVYVHDPVRGRNILVSTAYFNGQLSTADVNGDGALDLISRSDYGELQVWLHSGSFVLDELGRAFTTFGGPVTVGTGWQMHDLIT